MKMKHWMFLAAAISLAGIANLALAQTAPPPVPDTTPPVIPAGDTPAPPTSGAVSTPETKSPSARSKKAAASKKPKKTATKPKVVSEDKAADKAGHAASSAQSAPRLSPGPAVAKEKNVNVRGQAAINSEIVTHLKRGDLVTVLEEITIKKPRTDEPDRWAKVALPAGSAVWVNTSFLDPNTKATLPKRLNVRSGPGENFSILGRIEKGTVVKELETKDTWTKIEAPTNSYAFIAAHLLSSDPADLGPALAKASPPAPATPPPAPTETTVVAAPPPPPPAAPITPPVVAVVPPPAPPAPPTTPAPAPAVVPPPPLPAPTVAVTPPPPAQDETPIKRVVIREGIVKGSASIQAPTYLVLRSLDNNKTINYLHSPSTNLVLKGFQYQRVLVTGEELLDERWPNTPVINVESIVAVQ